MKTMWKFIIVMYFISVGPRGTSTARLTIWRMNEEDIARGFAFHNKLQRGLVPPPQCHHRLSSLSHSKVYSSESYVACP
ncbi:uncharacterized protein LOC108872353 [Brassica rapa]|uniref:uncharacterized protein LOC108872353 n=1 Tax=Brassica campestris TaxID=3711 RepID=UPI000871F7CC|nr:uncharacterized protein LOC108872353 [Brassica rapa]